MASVETPRTRLTREDRMEQTLTAARALFAARGYAAVTMDEVAAAVGVTKPLLYIDDRAGPAPPLQPLFPSLPNPTER